MSRCCESYHEEYIDVHLVLHIEAMRLLNDGESDERAKLSRNGTLSYMLLVDGPVPTHWIPIGDDETSKEQAQLHVHLIHGWLFGLKPRLCSGFLDLMNAIP